MVPTSPDNLSKQGDPNLDLIRLEFARIDAMIERQVRNWQSTGQDSEDVYRGLYISDAEIEGLLNKPLATGWGQGENDNRIELGEFHRRIKYIESAIQQVEEQAKQSGIKLKLRHLQQEFNLDAFEKDAFLIVLAPMVDLRYERFYGFLQDDVTRKRATPNLILNLLSVPGPARFKQLTSFMENSPLIKHQLLRWSRDGYEKEVLLNRPLSVEEPIFTWLFSRYEPSAAIMPYVKQINPIYSGEEWAAPADFLLGFKQIETGIPVIVLTGEDEIRKQAALQTLANRTGRVVCCLDIGKIPQSEPIGWAHLREFLRDCRLNCAIPSIHHWDEFINANPIPGSILEEILAFPERVVICARHDWSPSGINRSRNIMRFNFSIPEYKERLNFWSYFIEDTAIASAPGLANLAGQFLLTSGQIRDAVASANDQAAQQGRSLNLEDLYSAARQHSNPGLAGLARKIRTEFDWEDLVLPEDPLAILKELLNSVKSRLVVLDEWGVGQKLAPNRGVTVLFAGPPGTGKTMSAGILARELGLDLYKIDLSTVVSKYIGETEKNLERIFIEAETSNSILFFDEADALFGKRSEVKDAHDRYANIEISFLLQRMEAYNGVTILATNMRSNLDEAFTRRLQFAVDFPFPDEPYRLQIWRTIFPPGVPKGDDIDFPLLARKFRLAGGNIRNIIINAAYLAASDGGCVRMSHILHGTRRELQKMGRLTSETDFI